jgi:mono/diheme cytochrome c family protein
MTRSRYVFGLTAMACAAALLAACATPPPAGEAEASGWPGIATSTSEQVAAGRSIAETQCATCHAIGATTASPLAGAPPLRDVLALYENDESLAYRFINGMKVGHDEMPQFDFDVQGADALIAYLRSIG